MRAHRHHLLLLGALAAVLASGCDNDKAGGTHDSGTSPDAVVQLDASTQPDAAAQADGSTDPDGAAPDAAPDPDGAVGPDGGPDAGGGGDLVISWSSVTMWGNCMPMVPPDPWNGSFDLIYDNTAGSAPANATVLSVKMVFQVATNPTLDITVTPVTAGPIPAGTSATITHTKTGSTNDLVGDCGFCGGTVVYQITLNVGGQPQVVTSPPQPVTCAY